MSDASFDAGGFATAFLQFMDDVRTLAPVQGERLRGIVREHLGVEPKDVPTVAETFSTADRPNLQLALNSIEEASPNSRLIGLPPELGNYGHVSLAGILNGRMGLPAEPTAVSYVNVAIDVDRTLPCVSLGVYLLQLEGVPVVALVYRTDRGMTDELNLEVVAADRSTAATFLEHVRELMVEHNVYRSKVLTFSFSRHGTFGVAFHRVPKLSREQVILPENDLLAIERHTVGIGEHADRLREMGRHLKRGLLLYGPPGTGKTLSIMYLCNLMPERTTVLLGGPSAGALGQAVAIARSLQPAMIVIEDVDLIALERTHPGMPSNPLLFQLLNEMDGLSADADIVFALTTNRVELLEPALAARPGRIDQAVEIKLPDADSRRRLFELYLADVEAEPIDLTLMIERTEGVSAAFIKELVRRAVLTVLEDGGRLLTASDLERSLLAFMTDSAPVLRSILGAGDIR